MIGLNGKSFIPLLSSFACAVPGIMATRTIENRQGRFVTILIAPLMSCSARLPVYVLLIGAFVPATSVLGGLMSLQAATLLALYFVGVAVAIPIALVLKLTLLRGAPQPFLMELPTYKWPSPRTVFYRAYEQGKEFCVSAGTIIFAVAIIVWALGYYPRSASISASHEAERVDARTAHQGALGAVASKYGESVTADNVTSHTAVAAALASIEKIHEEFRAATAAEGIEKDSEPWSLARRAADSRVEAYAAGAGRAGAAARDLHREKEKLAAALSRIDHHEAGAQLRQSILGRMGRWIEPVVIPLGWDWRIGTAVIAAFPAREVVVATMGTIYNLGEQPGQAPTGLRQKLREATWPDGRPVYNLAVALSVMVFFALCCQCGATLAAIKREMRSWLWPLLAFTYMTTLAYLGAFATFQVASRLM